MADYQKQKEESKRIKQEETEKLQKENLEKRKALQDAIKLKQKSLLEKRQKERELLKMEINVFYLPFKNVPKKHTMQLTKNEKEETFQEKSEKAKMQKTQEIHLKTKKDEEFVFLRKYSKNNRKLRKIKQKKKWRIELLGKHKKI